MEISKTQILGIIILGCIISYGITYGTSLLQTDISTLPISTIVIIGIVILVYPVFKLGYYIGNEISGLNTTTKPTDDIKKFNIDEHNNKL